MEHIWYCLIAMMIALYVVFDGFDLGAGKRKPSKGADKTAAGQRLMDMREVPFGTGEIGGCLRRLLFGEPQSARLQDVGTREQLIPSQIAFSDGGGQRAAQFQSRSHDHDQEQHGNSPADHPLSTSSAGPEPRSPPQLSHHDKSIQESGSAWPQMRRMAS